MSPAGPVASGGFAAHARVGRFVVLSAELPLDDGGSVVAGDIGEQTRAALARLDRAARRAGTSLARAAAVHVYLRDAADFAAMNAAYAPFFPTEPPTRTTIVGVTEPAARVAVAATLVAEGEPREVIHPAGWKPSAHPYSFGIRSGDTFFLSGLVSRRGADGSAVDGDAAVQTRAILDNARELLAAAGMTFADVVSARVFITTPEAFAPMNAVYREAFDGLRPPARATVVAPLMLSTLEVEITFLAVRDPGRRAIGPAGPLPFSPAIAAGDRLFVSGVLGNAAGALVDTPTQTREIVARIGATLEGGGCGWGDVRELLVYVTDVTLAPGVLQELARACPDGLPAGTVVETGLVVPDATVEIVATAARGPGGG